MWYAMRTIERKTDAVHELRTADDDDTGRLVDLLPLRDFPACVDAVDPACPRCAADLTRARGDWRACPECEYEMDADAVRLYQLLSAAFEAQPKEFFDWVERRRDRLRDEEPIWQRRP
ncbi:hypothetical protein GCM10010331_78030 [Streptomyces xanthochromogenes]|nr:hypothetical protein GCM10010331_78030 [Streptomyces xanthochromogenes]